MTSPAIRILIVDDERPIRRFLHTLLSPEYTVIEAANGEDALHAAAGEHPDLIILDLGMPDIDGVEVTRRLREWTQIPILILSVHDQEAEKIAALDAGADDYLTKPFSAGELLARLRVALRRAAQEPDEPIFECDGLVVDLTFRNVTLNGEPITLTPTEYDILRTMVKHAGKVLTHRQLLRAVWGINYENETHLLQVNISNLRRKIEPDPARPTYILTEPGVGYRLKLI